MLLSRFVFRHRNKLKKSELPMMTSSISAFSYLPEDIEKECDIYCTNYIEGEFSLMKKLNKPSSAVEAMMSQQRPRGTVPEFLELNASTVEYRVCSLYEPSGNYAGCNICDVINEKNVVSTRL
ncbi:hypothetical protein NPIL_451241 [Nephila pilipes]|uniref:Uncharacterized protein n=1 Tax=Nephila pilipes TaxID=299642 RepID=A0A8X6NF09_NEPPI|nr:hypothetical protein NPIL_451241 [Nephila pilipes]